MVRTLKVLLILCMAVAAAGAAPPKKNADVEQAIKSELVGKAFYTKILVGSYIPCPPNLNSSGRNDAIKMIDTELPTDGPVRYLARSGCFFPGGMSLDFVKNYVPADFSGQLLPGTTVWVRGVDFRDDRVEVRLSAYNNDNAEGSGKIKYMVGTNYRSWSADQLMEVIDRGIVIPAYEKMDQLKTEFEVLRGELDEAEKEYNLPGGTADSRLTKAIALRQVLEKLQKNRAEFAAMGKSDSQAGVYSEKLNALAPEIARLTEEARKERVAHIRDQLQAQLQELSRIQTQIRQKPPSSLAEWQQRSDILATYSTLLDIRQKLLDGLRSENEAPLPEDVKFMSESRAEIETDRKALSLGHQQIELADLTAQYSQMTRKRTQMLDAYSRAFGTARETPALHDLIAVLDQIVTNRDRAAALGDKAAATQLIQYQAETRKYKRKLSPSDPFAAYGGHEISATNTESEAPKKVSISAGVAVGLLLQKMEPVYPPIARAARVTGTVVLQATISKTGSVESLQVVSGPPILQGAAIDAVKTWLYRPFLLEGKPVEVETTVDVVFTLGG